MYTVSANLCDGHDYVSHWHGGAFDNPKEACDFYESWWPPENEVQKALLDNLEPGDDPDEYDLQIGVWDEEGNSLRFWSEGVTLEERCN